MAYSQKAREQVLKNINDVSYQNRNINLSFGYVMYDLMRLQLEELHRIANAMESLAENFNQVQQNQ